MDLLMNKTSKWTHRIDSTVAEMLCTAQTHMLRCLWVLFCIEDDEIVKENWKEKATW